MQEYEMLWAAAEKNPIIRDGTLDSIAPVKSSCQMSFTDFH